MAGESETTPSSEAKDFLPQGAATPLFEVVSQL
jgi:hypothetical protein